MMPLLVAAFFLAAPQTGTLQRFNDARARLKLALPSHWQILEVDYACQRAGQTAEPSTCVGPVGLEPPGDPGGPSPLQLQIWTTDASTYRRRQPHHDARLEQRAVRVGGAHATRLDYDYAAAEGEGVYVVVYEVRRGQELVRLTFEHSTCALCTGLPSSAKQRSAAQALIDAIVTSARWQKRPQ